MARSPARCGPEAGQLLAGRFGGWVADEREQMALANIQEARELGDHRRTRTGQAALPPADGLLAHRA